VVYVIQTIKSNFGVSRDNGTGLCSETEHKIIAISKVLNGIFRTVRLHYDARELERHGNLLSERAVRYHSDYDGTRHTQPFGRDGRMLTVQGLEELKIALAPSMSGLSLRNWNAGFSNNL